MSDYTNVLGSKAVDVFALGTSSIIDAEHTLELQRELMACDENDLDHSTIMQAMEKFIAQGSLEDEDFGYITDEKAMPKDEEINLDYKLEDPLNPYTPTKMDVTSTDLPQLVYTNNLPSLVTEPVRMVSALVEPATQCARVTPSSGDYSVEPSHILKRPIGTQSNSVQSVSIVVTPNRTPHVSQSKVPSAIGKKPFCNICCLDFSNKKQLNVHMRCIHLKYRCSMCLKTYRSYLGVLLHKSEHPARCVSCKGFFNNIEFIDHKITCHLQKFKCSICKCSLKNHEELSEHYYTVHSKFKCHICDTLSCSMQSFKRHKQLHQTWQNNCLICMCVCKSKQLRKHYHYEHTKYQCPTCYLRLASPDALRRHVETHANEHWCSTCKACFGTNEALEQHITCKHQCRMCELKFLAPTDLATHQITHFMAGQMVLLPPISTIVPPEGNSHSSRPDVNSSIQQAVSPCESAVPEKPNVHKSSCTDIQEEVCVIGSSRRPPTTDEIRSSDTVTQADGFVIGNSRTPPSPTTDKVRSYDTDSQADGFVSGNSRRPPSPTIDEVRSSDTDMQADGFVIGNSRTPPSPTTDKVRSYDTDSQVDGFVSGNSRRPSSPTTDEVRSYDTDTQADGFVIGNSRRPPSPTTDEVRSSDTDTQADGFVIGNSRRPPSPTADEVRSSDTDTQADGFVIGNSRRPPSPTTDEVRSSDTDTQADGFVIGNSRRPPSPTIDEVRSSDIDTQADGFVSGNSRRPPTTDEVRSSDTDMPEGLSSTVVPPVEDNEVIEVSFIQYPLGDKHQDNLPVNSIHTNLQVEPLHKSQVGGYQCVFCDLQLPTMDEMRVHKSSHPKYSYRCKKCSTWYITKVGLDSHCNREHGMCASGFTKSQLNGQNGVDGREMQLTAEAESSVCCVVVDQPKDVGAQTVSPHSELQRRDLDSSRGSLNEVRSVDEMPTVKYRCEFCRLLLHSLKDYTAHQKIHQAKLQCALCYALLDSLEDLIAHEETHTVEYRCRICKLQVESIEQLWVHEKVHMVKFQCNFCGLVFDKLEDKMNHERMHTHKYQCNVCSSYFNTSEDCSVHEKTHKISYECSFCNMFLDTQQDLTIHENAHRE